MINQSQQNIPQQSTQNQVQQATQGGNYSTGSGGGGGSIVSSGISSITTTSGMAQQISAGGLLGVNIIVEPYIDELARWEEAQKTHLGKLLAKPNYEIRHNFYSSTITNIKHNTIIKWP